MVYHWVSYERQLCLVTHRVKFYLFFLNDDLFMDKEAINIEGKEQEQIVTNYQS